MTTELITYQSAGAMMMDTATIDRIERVADIMASGKTTLPAHLRGSKGDCFAICLQAMQWQMNPFAVAQKTHLVNGALGYEAQLVAAVINSSGTVTTRFSFEFFGPWEKVIGKFAIKKGEKGEYRVPGWTMADEDGCGVRIAATLKGESTPRVLELLLAQARVRNSTLWADDPKQQLAYLGQKKWARLYAPDVIMGVYTQDELAEPAEKYMGAAEVIPPAQQARPVWDDAQWDKTVPKLADGIAKGKTIEAALSWASTRADVTPEQEARLRAAVAERESAATIVVEHETKSGAPQINADTLAADMLRATTLDQLNDLATLIGALPDATARDQVQAVFESARTRLEAL